MRKTNVAWGNEFYLFPINNQVEFGKKNHRSGYILIILSSGLDGNVVSCGVTIYVAFTLHWCTAQV